MKKYLFTSIALLIGFLSIAQNSDEAKKLLDEVSTTMQTYDNVYIEFDYSLINLDADVEQKNEGDLWLKGEKYIVNFFGSTQLFDGSKTYTIISENEEVNISANDSENENSITPSKFYSFYKNGYSYNLEGTKQLDGKQIQMIRLIPIDSNSEISEVLLDIETKSNHIYRITEIGNNNTQTILTVKKFLANQDVSENKFTFDREKYNKLDYTIND